MNNYYKILHLPIVYFKRILYRKNYNDFYRYNKTNKLKAIKIGCKILKKNKMDIKLRADLAKCYAESERKEYAGQLMFNGLSQKVIEEILSKLDKIDRTLKESNSPFYRYKPIYTRGISHLAMIEHIEEVEHNELGKNYITKIANRHNIIREINFYKNFRIHFRKLNEFTPELLSIEHINNQGIYLLTIQKHDGSSPNERNINELLKIHKTITSIKKDNVKEISMNKISNWFKTRIVWVLFKRISLNKAFILINHKSMNKFILNSVLKRMKSQKYSIKSINCFIALQKLIIDGKLYKKIEPDKHYTFLHGDFHKGNIIANQCSGICKVIDWDTYKVGPKVIDMVRLFEGYSYTFDEIEKIYLDNPLFHDHLDEIDKACFIYILMISWFNRMNKAEFEESFKTRILPAINRMKKLVNFTNDSKLHEF